MSAEKEGFEGQTIKGYELKKRIGKGGFGEVYLAHQALLKRDVAVKVVLEQYVNDPDFIRRFEAEAQVISHLEHLHIVPLFDFWRDPTGAFLVMRFLRGGSLHDFLKKGHWPIHDAPRVVSQLASALALAHRNGVIHRDVKPENILLDEDRNVYLVDFGIAKDLQHISDHAERFEKFEAEMEGFIGSPHYISPEQIMNREIGPEADIYNFGLVIYELITGHKPYEGLPFSTLISKHLSEPLPHIHDFRPDLPEEINHVIDRATEKDPANRYSDAMQLAADFRNAVALTSPEVLSQFDQNTVLAFEYDPNNVPPDNIDTDFDVINPYKGLRAFQESEADEFFGREFLVDILLSRFRGDDVASQFLALVGPSGSGKSSIAKAGLLPKLRHGAVEGSDSWFIVEMVPGAYPMEELEAALLRIAVNPPASLLQQMNEDERGIARTIKRVLPTEGSELLLVIDQFEEVFTQVEDEQARRHFLNALSEAISDTNCHLRVILTLRADFYDRPLLYPKIGKLISDHAVTVLPLNSDELTRAIVEPAEKAGLTVDKDLVAQILADVGEQAGALPLMQYALTELFERRHHRRLLLQVYHEIGGVTGALARRADELFADFSEEHKIAARQVFMRLVMLGEGSEDTRRRARLSELLSIQLDDEQIQHVIDTYGKYRLLTFDRDPATRTPTVEIAHEALIRQWQQLHQWLDDSREDLRLQRRLGSAATEWQTANNDKSFLASGTRLQQFEEWIQQTDIILSESERAYFEASLTERSHQEKLEQERLAQEATLRQRARNFLVGLVVVLAVATVAAFGLSFFAFNQREVAETQRELAEFSAQTATIAQGEALEESRNAATQAAIAEANEITSKYLAYTSGAQLALANDNTDLAILLAMLANEPDDSTIASRRVLAQAAYTAGTRWVMDAQSERLEAADISPDGQTAIIAGRDAKIYLLDIASGDIIRTFEGHADWIWDANFSADGTQIVSASSDFTVKLWDVASGDVIRTYEGHEAAVRAVAISSDGTKILSSSDDRTVILWDAETGDILQQSDELGFVALDVDISPSGFSALSGQLDGSIIWWNLTTMQPLAVFTEAQGGHSDQVWAVQYMPDETGFVSGSQDGTLRYWSFEAQTPTIIYEGHNGRVTSLDISSDGSRIVSGSEDNSVILWDTATGALLKRFVGHTFLVYGVAFSPDARQVLSASWDTTARLWDTSSGAEITNFADVHSNDVMSVAYSPDGIMAASAALDESILIWNMETGEIVHQLAGHSGGTNSIAFNSDGTLMASGGNDNQVNLWDVASGELTQTFAGHSDVVRAVTFSPNDRLIASGGDDNTIIIWNIESGEQFARLFGHTFHVTDVAFSPDGQELASSGFDNLVLIWDLQRREVERELEGHSDWVWSVAYSPDGRMILSASADNSLILWDAATGTRLRRFEGHSALVYDANFSPDGSIIASASADRIIILWDVATGQVIQQIEAHDDAVESVAFSTTGAQLLSAGADDTVRLWAVRLTAEELFAWVNANRYVRDLTCTERDSFFIEPLCPTPTPIVIPGEI